LIAVLYQSSSLPPHGDADINEMKKTEGIVAIY